MEIYLDNSATTKCFLRVSETVSKVMLDAYGNPSSMHSKGVEAEKYMRDATEIIAQNLKVSAKEIIFTSGGTESDNLAIIGAAMANHRRGHHLITTRIEHPAVLQSMKYLEEHGFTVTYLPVNKEGVISLSDLQAAITKETILVSIMYVNNEIGSVQPIAKAGELIKKCNPDTLFHVDAVQAYGKYRILPKRMGIDLLAVSGHKIHGPKGIGFLYADEKVKISPLVVGGGQQRNIRSGTENVPGIAGLAAAVEENYKQLDADVTELYRLREFFTNGLMKLPGVTINGPSQTACAPHIVSASVRGIRAEVLLHALEEKGIYVSAGSACAAKKTSVSATLQAIGLPKELLDSTIRFSFSNFTTYEELKYTLEIFTDCLAKLRRYQRR